MFALCGSLSAIVFILTILFVFLRIAQIKAVDSSKQFTFCAKPTPNFSWTPQTGDLVIMQYENAGMRAYPRGFKDVPTHCGLLWVRDGKVCVIEATRFGGTSTLRDVMWNRFDGHGVRVVLMEDLLASADVYCSVRPLKSGKIDDLALRLQMESWASKLEFENLISPNMHPLDILAIGFGPLFPLLGSFFAKLSGLSSSKRYQVFCSEFISKLLQRLGHVQASFKKHWSIAPVSFTSKLKTLDNLSAFSSVPLQWHDEILLVCRQ